MLGFIYLGESSTAVCSNKNRSYMSSSKSDATNSCAPLGTRL